MKHVKTKLAALALSAALMLTLAACGGGDESKPSGESPFAAMETVDLDGNTVDSSAFAENKLTVVNAWNLGCTACIEEIPALDKLNREYADKGVSVMGLYYNFGTKLTDADRQEIAEVMENANAEYPQLLTSEDMMKTDELKEMATFPATYFVDAQGNIVDRVDGSNDYEGWKQVIDDMLEKVEADA